MPTAPDHRWRALFALAETRGGAVCAADARAVGLPGSTFRRRCHREGWRALGGGVWLAPGRSPTRTTLMHAALLAHGPLAALSHQTAMELHDLDRDRSPAIHVTIPHGQDTQPQTWTHRHRTRVWSDRDVVEHDGLRTTSPARTLLDSAGSMPQHRILAGMLQLRQRDLATAADFRWQHGRRPRIKGAGHYRLAIEELAVSSADSILEARVRAMLLDAALVPTDGPHPVHCEGTTLWVDLAFPDRRVAVECDGFAFHQDRSAFERDRRRWRLLREAGWRIVWVTWDRAHDDADDVIREVATALAA